MAVPLILFIFAAVAACGLENSKTIERIKTYDGYYAICDCEGEKVNK